MYKNVCSYVLEIYAFVGEEFVVVVVLYLGHVAGDVDVAEELFWKVAACQAKAGFGTALRNQIFELLFGQQAVMHGVVYLVTDDELVIARCRGIEGNIVRFLRGLLVLLRRDICRRDISGVVETFAALVKQQVVFIYRHDIAYERVLADAPVFYKLHEGDFPACTEGACEQTDRGRCFALAFAFVHHYNRFFGLKIFKTHM